jgi:hypothetical protein
MVFRCSACHNLITSNEHNKKCLTIKMFEYKNIDFEYLKDYNVMTYGLGSCIGLIIVNYDKKHIIFAHNPNKYNIISLIKKYKSDGCVIYIKFKYEYKKLPNGKYKLDDSLPWLNFDLSNVKLITEPYNGTRSINTNNDYDYNSSLYIKYEDNIIKYTNNYGVWKPLI